MAPALTLSSSWRLHLKFSPQPDFRQNNILDFRFYGAGERYEAEDEWPVAYCFEPEPAMRAACWAHAASRREARSNARLMEASLKLAIAPRA